MSFKDEIERSKQLNQQVVSIKEKIKVVAEKTNTEIEFGVDTVETLIDKVSGNLINVSMVQKENGAYTLTVTKG